MYALSSTSPRIHCNKSDVEQLVEFIKLMCFTFCLDLLDSLVSKSVFDLCKVSCL